MVAERMTSWFRFAAGRVSGTVRLPLAAVGAILVFLLAVQLLGAATEASTPLLRRVLVRVVQGDLPALGIGWLAAYILGTGSVVAALGLSIFTVDLLTVPQLFLLLVGSRLGAAAIVVFIGAVDYFQRRQLTIVESVSMGMLTFLLTLSVYLPVAGVGYAVLPHLDTSLIGESIRLGLPGDPFGFIEPVTRAVTAFLGPVVSVLVAVTLLFSSLKLLDRVLAEVDTGAVRRQLFDRFRRTWVAFGLGLFITGLTTSVAFSLGVIVPL